MTTSERTPTMTTKSYDIFCISKANGNVYVHRYLVFAGNVKEAKEKASKLLREKLGRHAFNLTNGKLPTNWDWPVIADHRGTTIDAIKEAALDAKGWAIYA